MCLAGNYCDSDKSFACPGVFLTIFRKDATLKVCVTGLRNSGKSGDV